MPGRRHIHRPTRPPASTPTAATAFALALAAASAVAACSTTTEPGASTTTSTRVATTAAPATAAPRREGETEGAYVFRTQCAGCHGTRGEGNVGPPLADVADRLTAADELAVVRAGRGRMPAFSPALSDEQLAAVVEHTRTGLR